MYPRQRLPITEWLHAGLTDVCFRIASTAYVCGITQQLRGDRYASV